MSSIFRSGTRPPCVSTLAARVEIQDAELAWRAAHDDLSGLLNRQGVEATISDRVVPDGAVMAILVELERFRLVNETLGHAAGDAVIATIGQRLRALCQPGDIPGRIGGDAFIVLRPGGGTSDFDSFAREALAALSAPVVHDGRTCRFGAAMGAAEGRVEDIAGGEILRRASHALRRAKGAGRGRFCRFDAGMERRFRDRARMASDLERAIEAGEIGVAYMPKARAGDRSLCGFEALVRWEHPELGILMPGAFMPIAEDLKLAPVLDAHVLDQVLKDRAGWREAGQEAPTISVNISARRLGDPGLLRELDRRAIPPGAIRFELLETIFLDNAPDDVMRTCDGLRDMGIGIEIDDFGTGHASILGMTRIRPDWIKIDRALVGQVSDASSDATPLRAILQMASVLGISTVAEGIESETQAKTLEYLGCDVLQGTLVGVPVPQSDVPRCLRANARAA